MTKTQESANRLWWCWCWRWWKWCWWLSTEPADIGQNLDGSSTSWVSHYTFQNPGILVTVELQDLVQSIATDCVSSYKSVVSNFRMNLCDLEKITEQVNLIIDGQSSSHGQGKWKGGAGYNVPPPIVHTHLCQGRYFTVNQASSHDDILGYKKK